jgi:hypothetical protein
MEEKGTMSEAMSTGTRGTEEREVFLVYLWGVFGYAILL